MFTAQKLDSTEPFALSPAVQRVQLPSPLAMRRGGRLAHVQLAYETWGTLSAAKDNVVLVFTGLSPSTHAAASEADSRPGWWEYMIGPQHPIDTGRYFVVCVNSLGSCFGSTGPSSLDPDTGRPYALTFPELTVEDIAAAAYRALRELGIDTVHTVVGASLGGMTALAFAVQFPGAARRLVTISAAARATPFAIAIRSLQREIIRSDPLWADGNYDPGQGPVEGMRLARKLGLASYRSGLEWQGRFGRRRVAQPAGEPFGVEFEVESYLEANARKFVDHFDANSYLYLSRAMDWFDLGEHGESLVEVFERMGTAEQLVVGVETDILFPADQQQELARAAEAAGHRTRLVVLPSVQGHDAFLSDKERFAPVVGDFFA